MALKNFLNKLNQGLALETPKVERPKEPSPVCFDPGGLLAEVKQNAKTSQEAARTIDCLLSGGVLQSPWGFIVTDSPVIGGDYWIVSDNQARERIPAQVISFTIDELTAIMKAFNVFDGAEVVEVNKIIS